MTPDCILPTPEFCHCPECKRDLPAYQAARWTCECGASCVRCFLCMGNEAYWTVDEFRKSHACENPMKTLREVLGPRTP